MLLVGFTPNLGLAVTYITVFALLSILHTVLCIRGRNWWGFIAVVGGLCQVAGWSGRLAGMLYIRVSISPLIEFAGHFNPYGLGPYLCQQVTLVIGPVFWSAFCYTLMGKLIPKVGAQYSRFKPRTFIIFFIVVDVVCLVLQGIGGGMCGQAGDSGDDDLLSKSLSFPFESQADLCLELGQSIYLAGISVQLANTVLFAGLTYDYFRKMKKETQQSVKATGGIPVFRLYVGVMIVNFLIVLRNCLSVFAFHLLSIADSCCSREAELSEGFDGKLATVEVYVACLDALPMVFAFCALA